MRGQLAFHRARAHFSRCIQAYLARGAGRRQKSLRHRRANGIPDSTEPCGRACSVMWYLLATLPARGTGAITARVFPRSQSAGWTAWLQQIRDRLVTATPLSAGSSSDARALGGNAQCAPEPAAACHEANVPWPAKQFGFDPACQMKPTLPQDAERQAQATLAGTEGLPLVEPAQAACPRASDVRSGDWTFRSMHAVRILKLHRNGPGSVSQEHLLHDAAKVRSDFRHREIAAFFSLTRHPAQESSASWIIARLDRVFDIGVGPRLIQLVVKRCDYIFPRLIKGDDPVGATIGQRFRKDADCIIKCVIRDMDRTMIAAETAERTRFRLGLNRIFGAAALGMSCAFAGSQLVATDFLRRRCISVEDSPARQHEIENR